MSQVEAIEATGASPAQVMDYGIVPQIMPAFAGISVFRWDINIRESSVVGLVGAGGIGLNLEASLVDAGLDPGEPDAAGDPRHRAGERVGVRQGPARDDLTVRSATLCRLFLIEPRAVMHVEPPL